MTLKMQSWIRTGRFSLSPHLWKVLSGLPLAKPGIQNTKAMGNPPTPAPERGRRTGRVLRMRLLSSSPSSAPLLMGHGYDEDPYLFHIRFKSPVRANWRCRGCVVIIIITTVGDAEVTVMRLEMQRMRSHHYHHDCW